MIIDLTCDGCARPGRERGVSLAEAPDTVQLSGGLCRTCRRNGQWEPFHERTRRVDPRDFNPHRIAVEAGIPLEDLVLFPAPLFSKQYPVECRYCVWAKVAPTALLARTWAYKHFNSYIESTDNESS